MNSGINKGWLNKRMVEWRNTQCNKLMNVGMKNKWIMNEWQNEWWNGKMIEQWN